jgi:hypothetical protein
VNIDLLCRALIGLCCLGGTEVVKRRGYIPPERIASLLKAIVSDPTPLKYVGQASIEVQSDSPMRAQPIRAELGAEHRCEYPELPKAAAFVCTQGACSPPPFDGKALLALAKRLKTLGSERVKHFLCSARAGGRCG